MAGRKSVKKIVLVGAGHAHVEVLRSFRLKPEQGVELTLVTKATQTPYSGMFPGFIAGHYSQADINIRTDQLASFRGCMSKIGSAIELDADNRRVLLDDGRCVTGDLISIDVGANSAMNAAPLGTSNVAVKPMDEFEKHWLTLQREIMARGCRIAVVGAGAAGIELAFAMRKQMQRQGSAGEVVIFERGALMLEEFSTGARGRLSKILARQGIELRTNACGPANREAGGFDVLLWATGVVPAPWLAKSTLAKDPLGFIAVNRYLQSLSHPDIFAAGDAAGMVETPRAKSGVIAVRQGRCLADNLRRRALGLPLTSFVPQKQWLSLVTTGERYAVASWKGLSVEGRWVWLWKDWLDRRFIDRFSF